MKIKIDADKLIKVGGVLLTLAGTALSMVSTDKDNKKAIEKAVEKHFEQK